MVTASGESAGPDLACPKTAATVQTHNEPLQPALIDVAAAPPRFVRWGLVLLVVIVVFPPGCVAGVIAAALGRANLSPIAFVGLPSLIFIVCWAVRAQRTRAAARRLNLSDLPEALKTVLSAKDYADSASFMRILVNRLIGAGKTDCVIRLCSPEKLIPVHPVTVPFEPRPLNDVTASEFEGAQAGQRESDDWLAEQTSLSLGSGRARIRKAILTGVAACVLIWMVVKAIIAPGGISRDWMIVLAVIVAVFGVTWWRRKFPNPQVFLVPGGFLVRRSPWYSQRWSLHVYDRSHSVLIARQQIKESWQLRVADSEAQDTVVATEVQAAQALRAWLSPLAPPTLEQLSDLR
jgi:hypothetical protein